MYFHKEKGEKKVEKAEAPEGCGKSLALEKENKEKLMKRVKKCWFGSLGANVTPIRQNFVVQGRLYQLTGQTAFHGPEVSSACSHEHETYSEHSPHIHTSYSQNPTRTWAYRVR